MTAPTGDIHPGEIYWVTITPNETKGSEQYKRRPFVIVSRLKVNRSTKVVVGIPLTSTGAATLIHPPYRIIIPANEIVRDVGFKGDIHDSVALTEQVRVLDKTRLEGKMGALSNTALTAVGLGLAFLFDLR